MAVSSCEKPSPAAPTATRTSIVTAVRYERVRPITGDGTAPVVATLWYAIVPDDPYNRTSPRLCVMEQTAGGSFVCPAPRFEAIPVGRDWTAYITDPAVSALPVARDLYLNNSRVRAEVFTNGAEVGHFEIDVEGHVN